MVPRVFLNYADIEAPRLSSIDNVVHYYAVCMCVCMHAWTGFV